MTLPTPVAATRGTAPTVGTDPSAAMPSLDLLRALTDEHVLRAVMEHRRLTRAEVAAMTGISKPTISESVRRLTLAGILRDTGERTSGRGRAGSYYTLAADVGQALVVSIRPEGVRAESVDPFGTTVRLSTVELDAGSGPDEVARALGQAARDVTTAGPFRTATVSAADPVDRADGRLVQLPDAPLLVGDLDPISVLTGMVTGPILVDNDVNWAARAERDAWDGALDNFVYLHLGEGLGCAVMADGVVIRGHRGLAGEIAHVTTVGPDGTAMPLTEVFATLGLRRSGTTAIDVDRLESRLGTEPGGVATADVLARALAGVVAAAVAFADPELVVLGGPWGTNPHLTTALARSVAAAPRAVRIATSMCIALPDHIGARAHALSGLRNLVAAGVTPAGNAG